MGFRSAIVVHYITIIPSAVVNTIQLLKLYDQYCLQTAYICLRLSYSFHSIIGVCDKKLTLIVIPCMEYLSYHRTFSNRDDTEIT